MAFTLANLNDAQRQRARDFPKLLPAYESIYAKHGIANGDAARSLYSTDRPAWDAWHNDILKLNAQAGNMYSAQKGSSGFFGSGIGRILGAVAPAALSFIPGIGLPTSLALGAGIGGLTGGTKGALLGAVSAGAGKLLTGGLSGMGGLSGIANTLSPIGKILGAVNNVAGLFQKPQVPQTTALKQQRLSGPAEAPAFNPVRPNAMSRPTSLNELSTFAPEQARSALATKGLNSGLGADENNYYKNLLQRSLIGDGNKVDTSNPNFLMPIESSYFSGQGYNTNNVMDFLKGISA